MDNEIPNSLVYLCSWSCPKSKLPHPSPFIKKMTPLHLPLPTSPDPNALNSSRPVVS